MRGPLTRVTGARAVGPQPPPSTHLLRIGVAFQLVGRLGCTLKRLWVKHGRQVALRVAHGVRALRPGGDDKAARTTARSAFASHLARCPANNCAPVAARTAATRPVGMLVRGVDPGRGDEIVDAGRSTRERMVTCLRVYVCLLCLSLLAHLPDPRQASLQVLHNTAAARAHRGDHLWGGNRHKRRRCHHCRRRDGRRRDICGDGGGCGSRHGRHRPHALPQRIQILA